MARPTTPRRHRHLDRAPAGRPTPPDPAATRLFPKLCRAHRACDLVRCRKHHRLSSSPVAVWPCPGGRRTRAQDRAATNPTPNGDSSRSTTADPTIDVSRAQQAPTAGLGQAGEHPRRFVAARPLPDPVYDPSPAPLPDPSHYRRRCDGEEMPFTGHSLELMSSVVLRIPALTRSPGRARCWTRARRSARPVRSRARRCARRCRRCHRRGFRTRRCATRRALGCRAACTASRIAIAQRIARCGPSNIARKPSPDVFTSRPRNRTSCARTTASCASSKRMPVTVADLRRRDASSPRCR